MACKSAEHLRLKADNNKKTNKTDEVGEAALIYSMKIDLTPLLIAGGSGFERISTLYLYEGKA